VIIDAAMPGILRDTVKSLGRRLTPPRDPPSQQLGHLGGIIPPSLFFIGDLNRCWGWVGEFGSDIYG